MRRFAKIMVVSLFTGTGVAYAVAPATNKEHYTFLSQAQLSQLCKRYTQLNIISNTATEHILSYLRDKNSSIEVFRRQANRLIRILIEQGLSQMQKTQKLKETPLSLYDSSELHHADSDICIVSILRSGNAFLPEAMEILPGASIGQILIQRNEETAIPSHFYSKLPKDIGSKQILLVDPMLGTGGSASMAITILKKHGVKEENILFLNVIACEEGIAKLATDHSKVKIITSHVDPVLLKDKKYIVPGIGDFGDRYFGTEK